MRILFITSESEDREKLYERLEDEFPEAAYVSTEKAVSAWRKHCPAVTVFACNSLSDSESVYLSLLKSDSPAENHRNHQTLVLCRIDEAEAAYHRCRRHVFDDYAVFKPLHDPWQIQISLRRALALYETTAMLSSLQQQRSGAQSNPLEELASVRTPGTVQAHNSDRPLIPIAGSDEPETTRPLALVVEDDPFAQEVHKEILTTHGFAVTISSDGDSVMDAIEGRLPDLILMDINLPGVDGIEATLRLRNDPRTETTPIIVVSGHRERSIVESCIKAGANSYIFKPIREQKLLDRIRSVMPTETNGSGPSA